MAFGTFLLGTLVGVLVTLYHSALYPFGLIASLVVLAIFLGALRVLSTRRWPATTAAIAVVLSLTLLAGGDSSGSVLILADNPGFSLLLGAVIIIVGALAWPRITPRSKHYDSESLASERTPQQ